jgi:hypothetical protein
MLFDVLGWQPSLFGGRKKHVAGARATRYQRGRSPLADKPIVGPSARGYAAMLRDEKGEVQFRS